MSSNKKTLSGEDNKRLYGTTATNKETTAAWANMDQVDKATNVNIPGHYSIEKAKNWVDNGSKL